jgi:hypothetical protein
MGSGPRLGVRRQAHAALIGGLALLGFFASPTRALAGPEEALRAESLFRSGKAAYQRGDYATACPRLAESQRVEPAGGTLLALALCYEAWGKNATAWALFQQAEAVARSQGRNDRVALARERAQALEPGLSFVTVQLAAEAPPNVEVALDGLPLGIAALGTQTAVDAGSHRVEARHEGVVYFERTIDLAAKESASVQIPEPPAPSAPPPRVLPTPTPAPAPPPPPTGKRMAVRVEPPVPTRAEPASLLGRALPFVALGAGTSSMLVGGYFGVRAYQQNREVERGCRSEPCNPALASVHQSSKRNASLSSWLVGGGAVVAAGSFVWLFVRGSGDGQAAGELRVEASPRAAWVTVSGAF